MFSDAKKGDKVFHQGWGWGRVTGLYLHNDYPISVAFNGLTCNHQFDLDGVREGDTEPTLFWDKIEFEVPKRPKKEVRRTKTFYINLYKDGEVSAYSDEDDAVSDAEYMDAHGVKTLLWAKEMKTDYMEEV